MIMNDYPVYSAKFFAIIVTCLAASGASLPAARNVDRFGFFETSFTATGQYTNPYTELEASAVIRSPDGKTRTLGLFWDGQDVWKLRISPDLLGTWMFEVSCVDEGLNGQTGQFTCVRSQRKGSIQPMPGFSHHFAYQDGTPFLFWGDTAWGLYQDEASEKLNREAVFHYIDERAGQGINVVHSMLLQEAGWGNRGGDPFESMARQTLNPVYWQEIDVRLRYLNNKGIIGGLVLGWGDKRRKEPFAWRLFPNIEARKRYARYIGSRYRAYDVYFIVAGEWHAEIRTRANVTRQAIRDEFIQIGNALHDSDAHKRMAGIHPMTQDGSVREFNRAQWMSFADYQQNYHTLHARILELRPYSGPVVNSEYGYFLRDSNFDGHVDKNNSMTAESMRHATWDIIMAGGYAVTGYGTTYMGGNRDKGPFNVDDPRNDVWERQYHVPRRFLSRLDWWKLQPHDDWISSTASRTSDRNVRVGPRSLLSPPERTYWLLAEPGRSYVAYVRGLKDKVIIDLGPDADGIRKARLLDPRTGQSKPVDVKISQGRCEWAPPDERDWVLHLSR
jgi:hypothetical protein